MIKKIIFSLAICFLGAACNETMANPFDDTITVTFHNQKDWGIYDRIFIGDDAPLTVYTILSGSLPLRAGASITLRIPRDPRHPQVALWARMVPPGCDRPTCSNIASCKDPNGKFASGTYTIYQGDVCKKTG